MENKYLYLEMLNERLVKKKKNKQFLCGNQIISILRSRKEEEEKKGKFDRDKENII